MAIPSLRINIKSLTSEAKFNREESRRSKDPDTRNNLRSHLVWRVRFESRAAQLLYAIIRGKTRSQVEPHHRDVSPYWVDRLTKRVAEKSRTMGVRRLEEKDVREWFQDGGIALR